MIKTVLNTAYDFGEQSARFIGVTNRGLDTEHLSKSASSSASLFKDIFIKPKDGRSVIHLVAMGAAPYYPSNKNGDLFYDKGRSVDLACGDKADLHKGLTDTHKTFETDAKVFKEHFNTSKDKVYGDVLHSRYNDELNRVELLISIPEEEWVDELQDLESGRDVGFSMSCRLPFDQCNVCGNKAKTKREYCPHIKDQLGQILSDGHQVAAINDGVTFFDISGVRNPADRIAFGLLKAASKVNVGGAELAEMLRIPTPELHNLSKFGSTLRKLAEIEKTIEATASADDPLNSAAVNKDIPEECMCALQDSRLSSEQTLSVLADQKITLSLKDFLKILLGPKFNEVSQFVDGAEDRLPGVFSRMCVDPKVQDGVVGLPDTPTPLSFGPVLNELVEQNSYQDEPVRRRVTMVVLNGAPKVKVKSASVSRPENEVEEVLAQLYGQYKAAVCHKLSDNKDLTFYNVLGHYIGKGE